MEKMLTVSGNIIGGAGVAICALVGIARLFGAYHVAGFEALTLFVGGIALMVLACLVKLYELSERVG